jgi:hypothetical protein
MSSREDRRADALEWTRELLYGYDAQPDDERWLDDCPHWDGKGWTPCDTATECERRAEECACVEPHEDPKHCAPWLREHDGEPKETDE